MKMKSLYMQTLAGGLLFLSGCDVVHSARNDLDRLTSSNPLSSTRSRQTTPATSTPGRPSKPVAPAEAAAANQPAKAETPDDKAQQAPVNIIGKSEGELQALLGPPTTVEERPPGKIWRYQNGRCRLDVQLYPDVQTRQYGTLAYEVKSDDNTDEGNRACMVQLRSRGQSRG